mgnify:FL=1
MTSILLKGTFDPGELNSARIGTGFLRRSGLLWKINHDLLHPHGLALAVGGTSAGELDDHSKTNPVQLLLLAAGEGEVWTFDPEIDETWGNRWELFVGCAPDLAEGIRSRHQLAAKPEERLWGPEGAENLEFDAASAYECNEYAFINDENEPRIMEEWTCTPLGEFVRPNVEHLIENLVERMADDVLLEDAWDSIEKMRLERDAEVVAAFEAAVAVLRSKLNTAGYRMADKLVAKHTITWVDEEPYMDGEPMYVKREETQP